MTQDEIIEMARQAGMEQDGDMWFSNLYKTDMDVHISHLETFAKLVAAKATAKEREACAKVADEYANGLERNYSEIIADAIRARGEQDQNICPKCRSFFCDNTCKVIAELESQEPVIDKSAAKRIATSLGWSPQRTWVGLTDEEVNEIYISVEEKVNGHWESGGTTMMFPSTLYKAIEAKLKEKNT